MGVKASLPTEGTSIGEQVADLTTRVKVKRALGIPAAVTMHDDYIDTLLEVADKQVLSYTGQAAITQTTITDEKYDVSNMYTNGFTLRNFPVSSITALKSGGDTLATSSWYLEERSGTVRLTNSSRFFDEGRQEISVTYVAGHATVPEDISHAATLICCAHFNRTRHAGFNRESMAAYSYRMEASAMPAGAAVLLASYRRIFPKEAQPT